jgi:hypothetical protein
MSNEIFILKLLTNEEIIGKVEEAEAMLFVKNPIQIFQMKDPNTGEMKLGMADYMPHAEDSNIIIMKTAVCTMSIPREALMNEYKQITGDIIIPSSKIQLA